MIDSYRSLLDRLRFYSRSILEEVYEVPKQKKHLFMKSKYFRGINQFLHKNSAAEEYLQIEYINPL